MQRIMDTEVNLDSPSNSNTEGGNLKTVKPKKNSPQKGLGRWRTDIIGRDQKAGEVGCDGMPKWSEAQ